MGSCPYMKCEGGYCYCMAKSEKRELLRTEIYNCSTIWHHCPDYRYAHRMGFEAVRDKSEK